jgi:hypothetical protein
MTDTRTDVQADEPQTVKLPGGGTAFKAPNGELRDVNLVTLKSLTRVGDAELDVALAWLLAERERIAADRAERLAGFDEATAKIRAAAEARQKQYEEFKAAAPWKFD